MSKHIAEIYGLQMILDELATAKKKFPEWQIDPLHALAVLGEEFGELTKDVLQCVYEPEKSSPDRVRAEAVQVAAMAIRFVENLNNYRYVPGPKG